MLCAEALRALEALTPVAQRVPPPDEPSVSESIESVTSEESPSTVPTEAGGGIGVARNVHSESHTISLNAGEKWIRAALLRLGKTVSELTLYNHEPNDPLASQIQSQIASWYTSHTTAAQAGVVDHRPSELAKCPPRHCLRNARGWMIRYINADRAKYGLRELPQDWGRTLANGRAETRHVNTVTRQDKAAAGTLYHHKHDLAPTLEELTSMTLCGWTADQRVHADVLESIEAGMSLGLYLPTGARGSELKKMHLQSLGHESIQDEKHGHVYECLKLTAFETKTKEHHLNQLLAHSNPWRCGVGLLGLSILVRNKLHGAPPFKMQTDAASWKIMGTPTTTLDDRIKAVFAVAGVRRQNGDPVTYLGRHFGTRLLQHAGGSAEGGAARRGHSHKDGGDYTECPLPDLKKLAGNDADKSFVAAHLSPSLAVAADAVVDALFPDLVAHDTLLKTRQLEVDRLPNAIAVRTKEQLNDQQRLVRGLRFACRTAVCCMVARPRSWKQWQIVEDTKTIWEYGTAMRSVATLFAGNGAAIEAMNALALAVLRCEEAELEARRVSPDKAIETAVVSALQRVQDAAAERERRMMEQQKHMMEQLVALVKPDVATLPSATEVGDRDTSAAVTTPCLSTTPVVTEPLASARLKNKRTSQDEVTHFSSWSSMADALEYARNELAPLERAEGAAWRIVKRADGREDKSRDKQWRCYLTLAAEFDRSGDMKKIQEDFESMRGHTAFLNSLRARHDGLNCRAFAFRVLGI